VGELVKQRPVRALKADTVRSHASQKNAALVCFEGEEARSAGQASLIGVFLAKRFAQPSKQSGCVRIICGVNAYREQQFARTPLLVKRITVPRPNGGKLRRPSLIEELLQDFL
jgi:hypothetical protein